MQNKRNNIREFSENMVNLPNFNKTKLNSSAKHAELKEYCVRVAVFMTFACCSVHIKFALKAKTLTCSVSPNITLER